MAGSEGHSRRRYVVHRRPPRFRRMAQERISVLSLHLRCSRFSCCRCPGYCSPGCRRPDWRLVNRKKADFRARLLWRCGRNVGAEGTRRYRQYLRLLRVYCRCRFMQAGMQRLRRVGSGSRSVCHSALDCAGHKVSARNTVALCRCLSVTCVP